MSDRVKYVEVATQAELDRLQPDEIAIIRKGHVVAWGSSHVEAWGSAHVAARETSHVVARGSSHVMARESAHVVAWGSAHVEAWESSHVVARESAHVEARESAHVVARGSAHVVARGSSHVEAWESSHVEAWGLSHVEAWESSHVVARESSHVVASKFAVTHCMSTSANVTGGVIVDVQINTAKDWCEFHGVPVVDGKAVLFKAVEDDWQGEWKKPRLVYKPGRTVKAPDWDPAASCGGGLHLSAHPWFGRDYCSEATHFLACEVDIDTIVMLGDKVKVPKLRVLHEVTIDSRKLIEEAS